MSEESRDPKTSRAGFVFCLSLVTQPAAAMPAACRWPWECRWRSHSLKQSS